MMTQYAVKIIIVFLCMYQVMKHDRFSTLMKFLHLVDNDHYVPKGQLGHDTLYKLRPFLEPLIANFQQPCIPYRELSVDEAMVGFKGRLSFIQYLPKKPTKWGMKSYPLAMCETGDCILVNSYYIQNTVIHICTEYAYKTE